jgi:hypothetical protein
MTAGGDCFLSFKNKHAIMLGRIDHKPLTGVNVRKQSSELEVAN